MTVLRAPGLVLDLDGAGTVVSAASAQAPATSWLVDSGTVTLTTPAGPLVLGAARVSVDADEVEAEWSSGGLRVVVRHAVEQAWTVRVVLANETDAGLALAEVRLGWQAAPGAVATALAAGARAAYAVQAADGAGPVLVGRLRSGVQRDVDATGLLLGPLVLGPHHRWAATWRWEVVPDARRASPSGDLPRTTWFDLDQGVVLPSSADVAVVAPGLAVEHEDDHVELTAVEPGSSVVELRSARGTTAYALTWAPDLDDLVDAAATELLAGPTTPAGTARLPDGAAGLVVLDALGRRSLGRPDDLTDALELLGGELAEQLEEPGGPTDPLTPAFLAREAGRTGDPALLDTAARGLAALLAAGGPPTGVGTELALVLRPPRAVADEPLLAALRRLGASCGAGLPGRVLPALDPEQVAYASAVFALTDEATGQRLRRQWGITASELARRTGAEARARVGPAGSGSGRRALAWLVLGRR